MYFPCVQCNMGPLDEKCVGPGLRAGHAQRTGAGFDQRCCAPPDRVRDPVPHSLIPHSLIPHGMQGGLPISCDPGHCRCEHSTLYLKSLEGHNFTTQRSIRLKVRWYRRKK